MKDYFLRNPTSPMGRLDVRLKMAMGFGMSLLAVMVDSLVALSTLAMIGVVFFLCTRPTFAQVKLVVFSCLLLVWGMMVSQGLFYNRFPRTPLVVLMEPNWLFPTGLSIYIQGIWYGMLQSLRVLAVSFTGYAVCFSTEPGRFLHGLLSIRVPFSLAFMAVTAIRFIPVAAREIGIVRTAMRLKGYRPFRSGLMDTVRTEINALHPILAGTIRRSEEIAMSIMSRGFKAGARRTALREERFGLPHWVALAFIAISVGLVSVCKIMFWLYQQELYYNASLRPIYAFAREQL